MAFDFAKWYNALPPPMHPNFKPAVKETIEVGTGQRGDPKNKWVTVEDLTNVSLIKYLNDQPQSVTRPQTVEYGGQLPEAPRNLDVVKSTDSTRIAVFAHHLTWTAPTDSTIQNFEIWSAGSNDRSSAVKVGAVAYPINEYSVPNPSPTGNAYYWVRSVGWNGKYSTWEPGPVAGGYVVPGSEALGDAIDRIIDTLKGQDPDAWVSGTTYSTGDQVKRLCADSVTRTYESLVDSNVGNDPDGDITNWKRIGFLCTGDVDGVPTVAIDGNLVVDKTILAQHISVTTLSTLSVNAGTITAGVLQNVAGTVKIDLTGSSITISANDGIVIKDGGDIHMEATTTNPSLITFSGTAYGAELFFDKDGDMFCLPTTSDVSVFTIGDKPIYSLRWGAVEVYSEAMLVTCEGSASGFIKFIYKTHTRLQIDDTYTTLTNAAGHVLISENGVSVSITAPNGGGVLLATNSYTDLQFNAATMVSLTSTGMTLKNASGTTRVTVGSTSVTLTGSGGTVGASSTQVYLNANAGNTAYLKVNGTTILSCSSSLVYLAQQLQTKNILPGTTNSHVIGSSVNYYLNMYINHLYFKTYATFDDKDDFALVRTIKTKKDKQGNPVNTAEGLGMIDMTAIPDILTNKSALAEELSKEAEDAVSVQEINDLIMDRKKKLKKAKKDVGFDDIKDRVFMDAGKLTMLSLGAINKLIDKVEQLEQQLGG